VFGSGGAGNFLTRLTTWIAIAFFITSFGLAYVAKQRSETMSNQGYTSNSSDRGACDLEREGSI